MMNAVASELYISIIFTLRLHKENVFLMPFVVQSLPIEGEIMVRIIKVALLR